MKIQLSTVLVDDQAKALKFYTEVLGFVAKHDVPMGEYRWISLVAPEGPDDVQLVLEPMGIPEAKTFQKALFEKGIPSNAFYVDDVQKEYERLKGMGVKFHVEPAQFGPVMLAKFEDGCGNMLQIFKPMGGQ
jgi:catechol 2,3-dioxygenase-like lactoylglutathione lyase family enzyme